MFRLSLGRLLIGVNVGLVSLAVILVALAGVARLEHLADEQALARVRLAGSIASKDLGQTGAEVRISASLLAERPTLARLLSEGDREALARFLERFQRTSLLSGCAVTMDSKVLTMAGASIPWDRIAPDRGGAAGNPFVQLLPGSPATLLMAAAAPVPGIPTGMVVTARVLDGEFEREISARIGLPVRILGRDAALAGDGDARADLRASALVDDRASSGLLQDPGLYVTVLPLAGPSGRPEGIVETVLEREAIASSLRDLKRSFGALAAGVAAAAALLSLLLARRLTRPLETLTGASARIGGGDLETPIPRAAGREVGTLSEAMEEMRRRLSALTAELNRRRAEAEAVLGGITEGVLAVDADRRIQYLNPQAAGLLGVAPAQALGRFCGEVLNPQGPGGVRPCEESCPIVHARSGGGARATEKLLLPGGRQRTVVITSAAAGAGGEARQFQVIRDETEVEAGRRLRDAVLANISHEFRTPLAAQLASIELLRDRLHEIGSPEAEQLVLALQRGTLRLTQLIDNLLESVRIEAGRHSIRRARVALDEVVEEATEMTAPLIAQRGQTLSVDLPYPLPPVPGDAPRLAQALVNLLANANKFSPDGSTIRIGGTVEGREVTVWVEDEGPGLPTGSAGSLFEPFMRGRGDEDEEPEQGGMGLGLWIVKSIVDRHGGRVEAGRAGGGAKGSPGTRVCMILPVMERDEDPRR